MELMKPYQTLFKKTPKKGREKEIRGKEQSPGKQIVQKSEPQGGEETIKYPNLH